MHLFLSVVLALPLVCLALLTFLALLGVLALGGAVRGVGAIRGSVGKGRRGLVEDGGGVRAANPLDYWKPRRSL
jgi:hypothetical protein